MECGTSCAYSTHILTSHGHLCKPFVAGSVRRAPTAPRTTSAAFRRRSPPGPGPPLGTRPAHGPTPLRLPPCSLAAAPRWQIAIARPSWPAQKLSQKSEIRVIFGLPAKRGLPCGAGRGMPVPPTGAFAGGLVASAACFCSHRNLVSTFFRISRLRALLSRFCVSVASVIMN